MKGTDVDRGFVSKPKRARTGGNLTLRCTLSHHLKGHDGFGSPPIKIIRFQYLVGGFNPSEKYQSVTVGMIIPYILSNT